MVLARSRRGLGFERNVTLCQLSFFPIIFARIQSMRDLIKITPLKIGLPSFEKSQLSQARGFAVAVV